MWFCLHTCFLLLVMIYLISFSCYFAAKLVIDFALLLRAVFRVFLVWLLVTCPHPSSSPSYTPHPFHHLPIPEILTHALFITYPYLHFHHIPIPPPPPHTHTSPSSSHTHTSPFITYPCPSITCPLPPTPIPLAAINWTRQNNFHFRL